MSSKRSPCLAFWHLKRESSMMMNKSGGTPDVFSCAPPLFSAFLRQLFLAKIPLMPLANSSYLFMTFS